MKDLAFSLLLLVTGLSVLGVISPLPANAKPAGSTCSLEFEAKGTDIQILIGYSKLKGSGRIACIDDSGKAEVLPFKMTIGTPVIFPRVSFVPSLVVRGRASGIAILKGGPQVILGKYLTIDIRGALGGSGFAKSMALEGQDGDLSFNLEIDDVDGFGIAVGGTIVTLE